MSSSPSSFASDAKFRLLASLPTLLDIIGLAELYGVHPETIREMLRENRLTFRNVSESRKHKRFLAAEVVAHLFGESLEEASKDDETNDETQKSKRGRPTGSKNKKMVEVARG